MSFAERLKEKRAEVGISQQALADAAGITARSIQNYEMGNRYPNSLAVTKKIATALHTTSDYLLGEEGFYVLDAESKGGDRARRDVQALVREVSGLFAGGELPQDDKDAVMQALTEAYWIAKEKNRKYASGNAKKQP